MSYIWAVILCWFYVLWLSSVCCISYKKSLMLVSDYNRSHCVTEFIEKNLKEFFSMICWHWGGTGNLNPSTWKKRTCLSCMGSAMAADGLATQRSQGISNLGIDLVIPWYPSFSMRRVDCSQWHQSICSCRVVSMTTRATTPARLTGLLWRWWY